ncbi:MAG: Putative cytosol aminopeptidase [Candidatus Tokpelaia hoelldobleri]|uniref:Probable cytosol aminopeptidase n=1 Tax=Candidatus Tokpelaia hoelldobleri TaxID=1902579 RepID=A0A1U9JUM2_9HYPH|nr:MAG: Putative cytosol aminopeptidase [Candidatus Tokpelaia hoelldoblerii]
MMSRKIQIKSVEIAEPVKGTLVVFMDEQGNFAQPALTVAGKDLLERLVKVTDFKGEKCKYVETVALEGAGFERLIVVGTGKPAALVQDDWMKLGGASLAAAGKAENISILPVVADYALNANNMTDFLCGLYLRHYVFDTYKQEKPKVKKSSLHVEVMAENAAETQGFLELAQGLAQSVNFARDLVNEPANCLGTDEFVEQITTLRDLGVTVEILAQKDMEKLGLAALLGVARGSRRPPYLAVMHWNGAPAQKQPVALVGKGVVFDSGGISVKPAAGMEDMKGDMGGAAAVVGTMRALAVRKARANIVGVVGLVENMPDGNAQRPGDVVKSMSGQTIEVINTDAEGRLVLADALWFTKERFKPRLMIDLATLTGAIMVALGLHHAGLFSNDDDLAENLCAAGQQTGEKLWRMPLGEAYDKQIDSKIADMRNSSGRLGGSITAAQFLQRFVGDMPWAHLDIAGTAMDAPKNEYNISWGSGFGVRLLDRLIADFYED